MPRRAILVGSFGLVLLIGLGLMAYAAFGPSKPDRLEMLALLRAEKFATLENYLDARQRAAERGELRDLEVHYDFSTFQDSDSALHAPLQNWVRQRPDSFSAHAARGHYFLHLAWLAENGGGSRATRGAQVMRMNNNFIQAKAEFDAALGANARMMTAVAGLMQIAASKKDQAEIAALYARGKAIDAASPTLHWQYLHVIQPYFGGSFAAIRAHTASLRDVAPDGRLDDLLGFYDYARGQEACRAADCDAGIAHFTKALTFGINPDYLFNRGATRTKIGDFDGARQDIGQAMALRPHKAGYYQGLAKLELTMLNFTAALAAYDRAVALDSGNPDYLEERAYTALRFNRNAEAERDMKAAQVLGDLNPRLQRSTAQFYIMVDKFKESLAPAKRSLELDPQNSRSWLWMAQTLYVNNDCQAHAAYARFTEMCRIDGQCDAVQGMALPDVIRYFRCDGAPLK